MSNLKIESLSIERNLKDILTDCSLTFSAGETWGILGKNGAGKSTLLQTLAGLLKAKSGEIKINDHTLLSFSKKEKAKKLGLLLQENKIYFSQTVRDYCELSRFPHLSFRQTLSEEDKKSVESALTLLSLTAFAQKNIQDLSGGEWQRVKIASLYIQDPDIFLLDEPCNHLDLKHAHHVLSLFKKLAKEKNKLIIMALHDLNQAAAYCDHILFLQEGAYFAGKKEALMDESRLSHLYDIPIIRVKQENHTYWHSQH